MAGEPPDGSLCDWHDIADAEPWQSLLLGNGLSINVWPRFAYGSLFEHAKNAGLTAEDRALFAATPNFERVLGDLNTAIRISEAVHVDPQPFAERYDNIRRVLGHAIRQVHVSRSRVPNEALARLRGVLERHQWIFTTSYDLLIYWAMGHGGRYRPFIDLFTGPRCEFNPARTTVMSAQVPVYFLHGALHLVVGGTGVTRKRTGTILRTLLEQFGEPVDGDEQARPLLVTEGSAQDKLRAIEANAYLSHALGRLRERDGPLVVFGSRLSEQDSHISSALSEHSDRTIAVSMMPGPKRELATQQIDIYGRVEVERLVFFDATTHPLGSSHLRAR